MLINASSPLKKTSTKISKSELSGTGKLLFGISLHLSLSTASLFLRLSHILLRYSCANRAVIAVLRMGAVYMSACGMLLCLAVARGEATQGLRSLVCASAAVSIRRSNNVLNSINTEKLKLYTIKGSIDSTKLKEITISDKIRSNYQ